MPDVKQTHPVYQALHLVADCRSLTAQVRCLVEAWRWQATDSILHALPLHHVHGIVNALHCAHYAGAAVDFLPKFSPGAVWEDLMVGCCRRCFATAQLGTA
jgi:acyl-CoA synthetase (AMP-forming)/AMP-acid ligase II